MFIATYDDYFGEGLTLEDAMEALEERAAHSVDIERDEVDFFEATKIQVEFKIVRKEKPVQVRAATKLVGGK